MPLSTSVSSAMSWLCSASVHAVPLQKRIHAIEAAASSEFENVSLSADGMHSSKSLSISSAALHPLPSSASLLPTSRFAYPIIIKSLTRISHLWLISIIR